MSKRSSIDSEQSDLFYPLNTSADVRALLRRRPEGYRSVNRVGAVHVLRSYQRKMHVIWDRSGLIPFYEWDPPTNKRGEPTGPRWYDHYRSFVRDAVTEGRITLDEGQRLVEYLDITGT